MFTGIVEDLGEVETVEYLGDFARIHVRSAVVTQDAKPGDSICVNGVCLTVTGLITSRTAPASPAADSTGAAEPSATPTGFTADVMGETLRHSSLKSVSPGTKVNLERSVRLADRLGGHLVQGHTDGTATIVSRDPQWSSGGATPRTSAPILPSSDSSIDVGGPRLEYSTPRGPSDGGAIVSDGPDWEVVRIGLPAGLARYVVHKGSVTVDGVSLTVSGIAGDWFEVSLIPETLKRTTLGLKQPGAEVNLEVDVIAKYTEKLLGGAR